LLVGTWKGKTYGTVSTGSHIFYKQLPVELY